MKKEIPDIDVVLDVLRQAHEIFPASKFISSLLNQYIERGSLSKKQLEGLHQKASSAKKIAPGKLATIQAIILRKHSKHRSTVSITGASEKMDDGSEKMITEILQKFPQHKRVLFFQLKKEKKEDLTSVEITELKKFHRLLCEANLGA